MLESNLSPETLSYMTKLNNGAGITNGSDRVNLRHISTGAYSLDLALCGGIPEAAISLVYRTSRFG